MIRQQRDRSILLTGKEKERGARLSSSTRVRRKSGAGQRICHQSNEFFAGGRGGLRVCAALVGCGDVSLTL